MIYGVIAWAISFAAVADATPGGDNMGEDRTAGNVCAVDGSFRPFCLLACVVWVRGPSPGGGGDRLEDVGGVLGAAAKFHGRDSIFVYAVAREAQQQSPAPCRS